MTFPPGFTWGVATSAYQIEGAWDADGKGESIWDRFAHTPGRIQGGQTGDVACDHYHRWREDIALMQELGVQAYRFSVSWPRVLPEGRGRVEPRGLDFYDALVDGLLEAGIEPWVTLYHWDLPQALQASGGWPVRDTAGAFAELAEAASRRLGDRVDAWVTLNEPWVVAVLGHRVGIHAPGLSDPRAAVDAAHHLLLAHGLAVPVIRANAPGARVGITLNLTDVVPASPSAIDAEAARRFDGELNRWYLDPLHGRGYPADVLADFRGERWLPDPWPAVRPGDMDLIAAPLDFLGVNYYFRTVARGGSEGNLPVQVAPAERTDFGWEITPDSLRALLERVHRDYRVPALYVTENGASYATAPVDGRINDDRRIAYLRGHIDACARAIANGVPLRGYFAWSLMDNFEWSEGFSQRFGLVWVDHDTQQRLPKDSAWFYRDLIAG